MNECWCACIDSSHSFAQFAVIDCDVLCSNSVEKMNYWSAHDIVRCRCAERGKMETKVWHRMSKILLHTLCHVERAWIGAEPIMLIEIMSGKFGVPEKLRIGKQFFLWFISVAGENVHIVSKLRRREIHKKIWFDREISFRRSDFWQKYAQLEKVALKNRKQQFVFRWLFQIMKTFWQWKWKKFK